MDRKHQTEIVAILETGQDISLASLRADGAPQVNVVSYASDGLSIYFGCGADSQKARNLARDDRVSGAVTLPYRDWAEIRGLSFFGRAHLLTDPDEISRVGLIFMAKFPEIAQFASMTEAPSLYRIEPEVISLLDYRQGFGHTDLVEVGTATA